MQSVTNVNNSEIGVLTAQDLREMTITKEVLYKKQKDSVLDSLMSSMVRIASEAGGTSYSANLNPQFDPKLLGEIVKDLENVGYKVSTEAKQDEKIGSFVLVTIEW